MPGGTTQIAEYLQWKPSEVGEVEGQRMFDAEKAPSSCQQES